MSPNFPLVALSAESLGLGRTGVRVRRGGQRRAGQRRPRWPRAGGGAGPQPALRGRPRIKPLYFSLLGGTDLFTHFSLTFFTPALPSSFRATLLVRHAFFVVVPSAAFSHLAAGWLASPAFQITRQCALSRPGLRRALLPESYLSTVRLPLPH